ncbi:LysE family translocator [Rhodococcus sp. H29-C3]|uniref:LysE family translocator n=1 Tax=Rhodococcus sp. H29-C3 TaxID=3046307 RepID=UPI0024B8F4BB|nr:LysE family translocator [Rhodococcus sp. H29-C3]MDJ0363463.1 LysE family translocator [Rhodococcus sp. H29-C3]
MVDLTVLLGFVAIVMLFLAPPGPDMAYMIAVGLEGGRDAALKAILGIGTGMSMYATAVVVGLGRIAQTHPAALGTVKLFGAGYLLWLAYGTIRNASQSLTSHSRVVTDRWYWRGLLVSVTNPKIVLFFLAVLPQFIGAADNPALQMALLGAIDVLIEVILYGGIGLLAGVFQSRFMASEKATSILNYAAGAVYLGLAASILVELSRSVFSPTSPTIG